jgi:hypothetical protein
MDYARSGSGSKINILLLQFWIRSTVYNTVKGIVQQILSGVETRLIFIHAGELEADPLFFLNLKGTPSQQEQKNIFSGLKIYEMALSDQIDLPSPEDD